MKKLIFIFSIIFLTSCYKGGNEWPTTVQNNSVYEVKKYSLQIDSALDVYGKKSLPKDDSGYYHMKLYPNTNQTFSRVVGKILVNGKPPLTPRQYVEWENNLNWYIQPGDTLIKITKSYINYFTGQFTVVQLPPLLANSVSLVKTTNSTSINAEDGTINNMIAPIYKMKGDTMILKAYHTESKLSAFIKIVLE